MSLNMRSFHIPPDADHRPFTVRVFPHISPRSPSRKMAEKPGECCKEVEHGNK